MIHSSLKEVKRKNSSKRISNSNSKILSFILRLESNLNQHIAMCVSNQKGSLIMFPSINGSVLIMHVLSKGLSFVMFISIRTQSWALIC